jgi:hypothetical protein
MLFGVENFIYMAALVADAILVDQCAPVLENVRHGISGIIQQVFYHAFRLPQDKANFLYLEVVDIL